MDCKNKVSIDTKIIEVQIKKVLEEFIKLYTISKEKVTTIDFSVENEGKVLPEKINIEIDMNALFAKISNEANSFKTLIQGLSQTKIQDFYIDNKCYNNNFSDINTLVNSIYDCQFKKIVDNLNIKKQKSFNIIKYIPYIIAFCIIVIFIILIKYYKK